MHIPVRSYSILVALAIAVLIVSCSESSGDVDALVSTSVAGTIGAQSNSEQQLPVSDGSPQTSIYCPDCQLVEVTGVVDGDTIDTSIGRVRFFGVDTPERGEECFTEATEFTRLLVGSQVRLEDGPRLEDTYGRRLAYIFDSSGNSIDVQLIAGGFAVAWTRDGQHRDVLVELAESAKVNRAGCLWAAHNSTSSSDYDPTGPDRDCGDFATWKEANDFFMAAGGPNADPHRLDSDHDGVPCQSLRQTTESAN
jgi:micrococcal nuclease